MDLFLLLLISLQEGLYSKQVAVKIYYHDLHMFSLIQIQHDLGHH